MSTAHGGEAATQGSASPAATQLLLGGSFYQHGHEVTDGFVSELHEAFTMSRGRVTLTDEPPGRRHRANVVDLRCRCAADHELPARLYTSPSPRDGLLSR